jgi:hypothetical protein
MDWRPGEWQPSLKIRSPFPIVPVAHLECESDGLEAGRVAAKLEDPAPPLPLFLIVPVAHFECEGDGQTAG